MANSIGAVVGVLGDHAGVGESDALRRSIAPGRTDSQAVPAHMTFGTMDSGFYPIRSANRVSMAATGSSEFDLAQLVFELGSVASIGL